MPQDNQVPATDANANANVETTQSTGQDTSKQTDTQASKTYTEAEMKELMNSTVSGRLNEQKAKLQEAFEAKLQEALAEEKRVAKLSAEEREKELESKRIKDLEDRERALNLKTNELEARKKLEEYKIPTKFVDLFLGEDQEQMFAKIETFKDEFSKAVEEGIEAKLSEGTSNKDVNTGMNQDQGSRSIPLTTTF